MSVVLRLASQSDTGLARVEDTLLVSSPVLQEVSAVWSRYLGGHLSLMIKILVISILLRWHPMQISVHRWIISLRQSSIIVGRNFLGQLPVIVVIIGIVINLFIVLGRVLDIVDAVIES